MHNLLLTGHYGGANNTHGYHFYVNNYFGMMDAGGTGFFTPNAWESWMLDWLTDFQTITPQNINASGIYELKDFVGNHAAIRIQIPHSDSAGQAGEHQYLWLEHHKGTQNYWDQKHQFIETQNAQMEQPVKGIYAYLVDRSGSNRDAPCDIGSNLIKAISPEGQYDWQVTGQKMASAYGSQLDVLEKGESNPLMGCGYRTALPFDKDQNGILALNQWDGNQNGGPYEKINIAAEKVNGSNKDHWKYTGSNGEAWLPGGEISLSGPVPALNYPLYFDNAQKYTGGPVQTFEPIYLNGLTVKFLGYNANGNAEIQVLFDDYELRANKRWCGNIVLPDFDPNSSSDELNIKSGVQLRIDLTGTPNRETIHPLTGDFFNPTTFTMESGAKMHLEAGAEVLVEDLSTFKMEAGSGMEIHSGAMLRVNSDATLRMEGGSSIYVHDGGRILVEGDGIFEYLAGASITLGGPNAVLEVNGDLRIGDGAVFTTSGTGEVHLGLPSPGGWMSNISLLDPIGTYSISLTGTGTTDPILRIADKTYLYPDANCASVQIEDGLVSLGEDSRINMGKADVVLRDLKITAINQQAPHSGLILNGQVNHLLGNLDIGYGKHGIRGYQMYNQGAVLRLSNSAIHHCGKGIEVFSKGARLDQVNLNLNDYGYYQHNATLDSRIAGCNITNQAIKGVVFTSAGASLEAEDCQIRQNGYDGIQFTGAGMLQASLNCITDNGSNGINLGWNSVLRMNALTRTFSNNTLTGNPVPIRMGGARDIYLDYGVNDIMSAPANAGTDLYGTLLSQTAGTIIKSARNNHWNNRNVPCKGKAPATGTDYNVSTFPGGGTVIFDDPNRHCPPANCPVGPPSPGGGGTALACGNCSSIQTQNFPNTPLNTAIESATAQMEKVDPNQDDLSAISLLHEIMTAPLSNPTPDDFRLFGLAQDHLQEAFTNACKNGKISIDSADHLPLCGLNAKLTLDAIAYHQNRCYQQGDSVGGIAAGMDVAQAYYTIGRSTDALQILQQLRPFSDTETQAANDRLTCYITAEADLLQGSITPDDFEFRIAACNGPSLKTGNSPGTTALETFSSQAPDELYWFPNPTNDFITISGGGDADISVRVFDLTGKEMLRNVIPGPSGQLDLRRLPSGVYLLRMEQEGGVVFGKVVKE